MYCMLSKVMSNWNIIPVFIAGIILIILLINDLTNIVPSSSSSSSPSSSSSSSSPSLLYIEYLLSFITSYVLFYWMVYPIIKDVYYYFNPGNVTYNIWGILFYYIYTIVLLLTSPFGLLSVRVFLLQDKTYVPFISILTIVSTLFTMYFTFGARNR